MNPTTWTIRFFATLLLIAMQAISGANVVAQETRQAFPQLKGLDGGLGNLNDLIGGPQVGPKLEISGRIVQVADQATGWLQVAVNLGEGWHIGSVTQPDGGPTRTTIEIQPSSQFRVIGPFQPDVPPTIVPADLFPVPEEYHVGRVVWTAKIQFAEGVDPASVQAAGFLVGQMCEDNGGCLPIGQKDTGFVAQFAGVAGGENTETATSDALPLPEVTALNNQAHSSVDQIADRVESGDVEPGNVVSAVDATGEETSIAGRLPKYIGLALLAGFILNFMPCVLPVIGLKIMSFVTQAGENRSRILQLNLAFCAGLLSVFWILATLSAFFSVSWGAWLTRSTAGPIAIAGVVFAFGLSMLGVWEIPVPGISGSSKAGQLAEQEGLSGAFFLGIFTTILATPCTGPLLVPATSITAGQPPWVAYVIFTALGLGMALPYLIIGFNPSLIRLLPKPGAWMDTFKQVMGFVLMATVVFLIRSFGEEPRSIYFLPVMSMLLIIAIGCWWIGRIPFSATSAQKVNGWASALLFIGLGTAAAFVYFAPPKYELDYQEFSVARLNELRSASRIVFIDFTGPN